MSDQLMQDLMKDIGEFENDFANHYGDNETRAILEDSDALLDQAIDERGFGEKAADTAAAVGKDVGLGVRQAPRRIVRGGVNAINSLLSIGDAINDKLNMPELQILNPEGKLDIDLLSQDEVKERFKEVQRLAAERGEEVPTEESFTIKNLAPAADESFTGEMIETIAQFAIGFKGVDKGLKVLRGGKAAKDATMLGNIGKGAAADVLAFQEHEERLSNVIESVPALQNPITEYLAADEDDSFAEGKLKQGIEGLTLGGFGDILFDGVRFVKKSRAAAKAGKESIEEGAEKAVKEVVEPMAEEAAGVTLDRTSLNVLGDIDSDELILKRAKQEASTKKGRITRKLNKAQKETVGIEAEAIIDKPATPINQDAVSVSDNGFDFKGQSKSYTSDIYAHSNEKPPKKVTDAFERHFDKHKDFSNVPQQTVPVAEIIPTQRFISQKNLNNVFDASKSTNAEIVKFNNKYYVMDGHHRIASNIIKGQSEITAHVLDLDPVDIQINFARIEGPDDIKRLMQEMANDPDLQGSVAKARRGVVKDEELLKSAQDVDGFADLMNRRQGEAFNDAQTIAARKLYYDTTDKLMEAAKKAAASDATDIDQFAFRKMIALHHAIQQEVLGARAEAARALRAWSLPVAGQDGMAVRQIENLVNEFGGTDASKNLARRLAAVGADGKLTTKQIDEVVNKSVMARSRKALEEAWTLGLLTSPRTHIVNVVSNVLTGQLLGLERMAASFAKDTPVEFKEGLEYFSAYFGSMREAMGNAAQAWRTGEVGIGLDKIDLPPQRATAREVLDPQGKAGIFSKAVDWYGAALNRYAGGALAAGDEFSKTILYKSQLRALAFRQARSLGLEGDALKDHIAKVLSDPPSNLRADAVEFANYGTYTNALTGGSREVQKAIARIPLARFVVPFVRTPVNIFKFTFERTPIGLLSENIRVDIAAGGLRRSQALAKIGMGTSVMYLGMDLSLNGTITGQGPADAKARGQLRSSGWQPYSIKIDGKYYSYARWEPFATWLGMSADMTEILTNYEAYDMAAQNEVDELVTAAVAAMANQVVGKTFLRGISDTTAVLADPKREGPMFLQRYAGSLVPTGVADIERALNPEVSQVFNMIDAMKARTPGLSKDVPPRRNVYGDVLKSFYPSEDSKLMAFTERAMSVFNPVYYSDADKPDNPLDQYFLKNGFNGPNMPQKTQKFEVPGTFGQEHVAINLRDYPEIYSRFLEKRGEVRLRQYKNRTMKEHLTALVNRETPESAMFFNERFTDHEMQEQHISNIVQAYDRQIRAELIEEYPVLRQTIVEEREASRLTNGNRGGQGLIREKSFP